MRAGATRAQAARRASPRPRPMGIHPCDSDDAHARRRSRSATLATDAVLHRSACSARVPSRAIALDDARAVHAAALARALASITASALGSQMFFGAEGRGLTPVAGRGAQGEP